jgi:hypothetical protein
MDAALAHLRKSGIAERDIKTVNYSVSPRYEYEEIACTRFPCPPGRQTLRGFEVSQSISVKVRAAEKAGEVVGGLGEVGVTAVSGVSFAVDDEDALRRDARRRAIEDAEEKAKLLATDLGVKLVRITSFSESGPGIFFERAVMAMDAKGGAVPPVPELPAGENKISSQVNITYEIR